MTSIKKYVLVVDVQDGSVAKGAGALKALGCDVAQVPSFGQALSAIRCLDRLSLVVVNCENMAHGHQEFLAAVRGLHPSLPVLLLGDACAVAARFLKQPGAAERGASVELLQNDAKKLLHDEFYRSELVEEVTNAAHRVLGEFGVATTRSEPYIKSNLSSLGDINALLGFSGEGLSGHLIVSACAENAFALHDRFVPTQANPQYDDVEDLFGEIANRVLGGIKRVFEAHSLPFKMRTPVFIRGSDARYRSQRAAPTLAIEFSENDGLLRLELCVDRMGGGPVPRPVDMEFLEAGKITFL